MKKKKTLVAIAAVLLFVVIGGTLAYFNSSAIFDNQFNLGNYNIVTQDVFTSPSNWSPGDTTAKTITATNNGSIDAVIRVKYDEEWTDSNGDEINNLPNDAVILNFTTPSEWTYDANDGYYYYNYYLKAGEVTTSLIESVTLNPNLNEANCVEENEVQTCTSDIPGLAGETYTLTFTIESVEYDKYQEVWNTNLAISDKQYLYVTNEIAIRIETLDKYNIVRENQSINYYSTGDRLGLSDGTLTRPTDKNAYLKYPVTNNQLVNGLNFVACIYSESYRNKELCLKYGEYEASSRKIKEYFGFDENTWINDENDTTTWYSDSTRAKTCSIMSGMIYCGDSNVGAYAVEAQNSVGLNDNILEYSCNISDGYGSCSEWSN